MCLLAWPVFRVASALLGGSVKTVCGRGQLGRHGKDEVEAGAESPLRNFNIFKYVLALFWLLLMLTINATPTTLSGWAYSSTIFAYSRTSSSIVSLLIMHLRVLSLLLVNCCIFDESGETLDLC